ncbi:MAG: Smr/MutS family protein [Chitinophagales bacterium]|nr:Smr/MutS family protein [Chitinophagales bacterium]
MKDLCDGSLGQEIIENQQFITDLDELENQLSQVEQFKQLIENEPQFPTKTWNHLKFLKRLAIEGSSLNETELIELFNILDSVKSIIKYFSNKERKEVYPKLEEIIHNIKFQHVALDEIVKIIDVKKEIVKEAASEQLRTIRNSIQKIEKQECSVFIATVRKYRAKDFLADQDESIRDERKVLAVKAEYKRSVPGIYHDDSANGTIAFIEPQETVTLNNELSSQKRAERREIEKILKILTDFLRPMLEDFYLYQDILGLFDAIKAKAYLAIQLGANRPEISSKGEFLLKNFRHPLLYLNYKKTGKEVVENTIRLHPKEKFLLISGPNAGGKSIILKSVGLLQAMFQFGMLIPADEGSQLPVMQQLFVDIGDAQSVDNDLSTYSSHLKNMKHFTQFSNYKTLVLLDELGHGTDPTLGGAMAEAVLENLLDKKAYAIVTTHHANLKTWGMETSGVINGAMSFDKKHLHPLYQLHTGSPGSSFTFEIASKSGINPKIIEVAKNKIGEQGNSMEISLTEIQHERQYLKDLKKSLQLREKQIKMLQDTYEQLKKQFEKEKKSLLKNLKLQYLEEFNAQNRELERLMREWKESKNDKQKFKETRQFIDEKRLEFEKEEKVDTPTPTQTSSTLAKIELQVGTQVKLDDNTAIGEILEIRKNKALVAFGSISSLVKLDRLTAVSEKAKHKAVIRIDTSERLAQRAAFESDLDIRGLTKIESMKMLDSYLDQAIMFGRPRVRIIHGRGTGAVREMVQLHLKKHPAVKDYYYEALEFGGDGVTIVEFR